MSISLQIDLSAIERLQARLVKLGQVNQEKLLDAIGQEVESQTVRRIATEKTAPDGTPWAALSPAYAATKRGGSILVRDQHLQNSIQYLVENSSVLVGSPMVYASTHQYGAEKGEFGATSFGAPIPWGDIPARPYLGLSGENISDLSALLDDFLDRHIARALQ